MLKLTDIGPEEPSDEAREDLGMPPPPDSTRMRVLEENAAIDRLLATRLRDIAEAFDPRWLGTDHAALISGAAALEYRADSYERRIRRLRRRIASARAAT